MRVIDRVQETDGLMQYIWISKKASSPQKSYVEAREWRRTRGSNIEMDGGLYAREENDNCNQRY